MFQACGQLVLLRQLHSSHVCSAQVRCYVNGIPVCRNNQGHRGTTADIGDNLLPSLTVFCCYLTAVEVETGPFSDVVFPSFLLPYSFSFPCPLCLVRRPSSRIRFLPVQAPEPWTHRAVVAPILLLILLTSWLPGFARASPSLLLPPHSLLLSTLPPSDYPASPRIFAV